MINSFYPCLWFNGQAKDAAEFYCRIFPDSKITADSGMVVNWQLSGQKFMGLNGGPQFVPNPSVSFFVNCATQQEADQIWAQLSESAFVMMAMDKYPWSEYYGFLKDKYGISWQIYVGPPNELNQKITACFLFTDSHYGEAFEAIQFYTDLFPNARKLDISFYSKEEAAGREGVVKHGEFVLNNILYKAMDGQGNHQFVFNEAISFVVGCDTQNEIDFLWEKLTEAGEEGQCGWLKDKFGVSWQIVPNSLGKLMSDPQKGPRVMEAFLKMKKFEISVLENA